MSGKSKQKWRNKRKNNHNSPYPEYVNVLSDNGRIKKVRYSDVITENEYAISDDIVFAYKCNEPEEYIDRFHLRLTDDLKKLKRSIRKDNSIVLRFDLETGRYVVADLDNGGQNE